VVGLPATIVRVGGLASWDRDHSSRLADGTVRVIARLRAIPSEALWPGIEAVVDV
jgi:hypothetical protein